VQARADHLGWRQKRIFRTRIELMRESHRRFLAARNRKSFEYFRKEMEPLMRRYYRNYKPLWKMVLSPMKELITGVGRRFVRRF
jgi:hypothetical protein